jgi:dimethylhistidine N-methyltransferase
MTSFNTRPRPVQLYDLHPPMDDFRAEILQGLQRSPKAISPKYLYDQSGAELFDAICTLEEYYLTRTEMAILRQHASEIATLIGDGVLVEFGSGSSQKVRILLDALPANVTYLGLDISKQHLYDACRQLAADYPSLEAIAICTDYTQPFDLPPIPALQHHKVGFFPGSSIGNLEPAEAVAFLKNTATLLQPQGDLLIGVDLKKDKAILEAAYCDRQGISAAFALNLLTRMNRELGAILTWSSLSTRRFTIPWDALKCFWLAALTKRSRWLALRFPLGRGNGCARNIPISIVWLSFRNSLYWQGFSPSRFGLIPNSTLVCIIYIFRNRWQEARYYWAESCEWWWNHRRLGDGD